MNTEEQTLIDGLFTRLKQAEDPSQPRDAQAQARIEEHVRQQPGAPYYMAQAILVQEAALKRLDEQNKQLEAQLKQARAQAQAAPSSQSQGGGGFLSSIFGGGARPPEPQRSAPVAPPSGGGGWREPASRGFGQQQAPAFGATPGAVGRSGAGGFLGGALQTAAGVAGGVMLAHGISSLFKDEAPAEDVAQASQEEAAPASDSGGWGQDEQQHVADDGGYADSDYGSDDGGFFSDDDTFV